MNSISKFFLFIGLCFGIFKANEAFALNIPALNSPVVDEVGLLKPAVKKQLEASLFQFKEKHQAQVQVYIISSLAGDSIESVAIKVFDQWKLGDEKTDRGLLFLIAPNEKRLRIEVGQGLEGDVPDVIAKRIIADIVRPYFQRGEFSGGVLQGVSAIQHYISNSDPNLKESLNQESQEKPKNSSLKNYAIFIAIGLWFLLFLVNPSLALNILFAVLNSRGGGGGRSGGGSWSGGGGRSSGGGASGGW